MPCWSKIWIHSCDASGLWQIAWLHDYTMISPDNFTSDIEFACPSWLVWGRCLQARCNLRDLQSSVLTRTSSICGDQKCAVIVSCRGHRFYKQIYHIRSLFPAACPTSIQQFWSLPCAKKDRNIWQAPKANFQSGIGATDLFAESVYHFGLQAWSIDLAMRRASFKNHGFSLTPTYPTYGKMTQTWRLEEL